MVSIFEWYAHFSADAQKMLWDDGRLFSELSITPSEYTQLRRNIWHTLDLPGAKSRMGPRHEWWGVFWDVTQQYLSDVQKIPHTGNADPSNDSSVPPGRREIWGRYSQLLRTMKMERETVLQAESRGKEQAVLRQAVLEEAGQATLHRGHSVFPLDRQSHVAEPIPVTALPSLAPSRSASEGIDHTPHVESNDEQSAFATDAIAESQPCAEPLVSTDLPQTATYPRLGEARTDRALVEDESPHIGVRPGWFEGAIGEALVTLRQPALSQQQQLVDALRSEMKADMSVMNEKVTGIQQSIEELKSILLGSGRQDTLPTTVDTGKRTMQETQAPEQTQRRSTRARSSQKE